MKMLATLLFVFLVLVAMPSTAAAEYYHCDLNASGYFSGHSESEYGAYSDGEAVGICQGGVNQSAINLCSGQGNTPVFYIDYDVYYIGPQGWSWVGGETVAWRCDNGWPVYA
jgi:hypothetical protein